VSLGLDLGFTGNFVVCDDWFVGVWSVSNVVVVLVRTMYIGGGVLVSLCVWSVFSTVVTHMANS